MTLIHFREVLQYVPSFRGQTFVVAVDGDVVDDPNFANLILDIGVLRSLSINVVLIHGIGAQLRRRSDAYGIAISNDDGTGATDDATIDLATVAAGECVQKVLGAFSSVSLPAAITNAVSVRPLGVIRGVDQEHTGKVLRVDRESIEACLEKQLIPVISPLGYDHSGKTLRVNSDTLAVEIALALSAKKIIFATTLDGIQTTGSLVRQMTVSQAEDFMRDSTEKSNDSLSRLESSKLSHATMACEKGIERVHIINGTTEEGLLAEVFSTEGIGTLVYADSYQSIRQANDGDVTFIHSLLEDGSSDDELIARRYEEISRLIDQHFVAEIDGNLVGCVAMHVYPPTESAELASFVVAEGHRNFGLGARLVEHVESEAKTLGLKKLFCLSTQAFTYFKREGHFKDGSPDDLPDERRNRWETNGRNSKILVKSLQ